MSDDILSCFEQIGEYRAGQFHIVHVWAKRKGVYAWARHTAAGLSILRIGIACGAGGIGGRHGLHNRWLAGKFKPDDAREQAIRGFTLEGLMDDDLVLAIEVQNRSQAAELEAKLRQHYGDQLRLDLSVRTSWVAWRMRAWRDGRGSPVMVP
jgi:hypothetical protein